MSGNITKDGRQVSYTITVEVREGSALHVARSASHSLDVGQGLTLDRIGLEILNVINPQPKPDPKRHPG